MEENYNNSMPIVQKIIAIVLIIVVIASALYLLIDYEIIKLVSTVERDINDDSNINITNMVPNTLERYKIISIETHNHNTVCAIVALSNGNIRIIEFTEAYIEPGLKNIAEGYLYRDGVQIFIRAE